MLTREAWFRARRADQGTGYSLIHWKGAVAIVGIVLLSCMAGLAPTPLLSSEPLRLIVGLAAGGAVFFVLLVSLIRISAENWKG